MAVCPKCGGPVQSSYEYCHICGQVLIDKNKDKENKVLPKKEKSQSQYNKPRSQSYSSRKPLTFENDPRFKNEEFNLQKSPVAYQAQGLIEYLQFVSKLSFAAIVVNIVPYARFLFFPLIFAVLIWSMFLTKSTSDYFKAIDSPAFSDFVLNIRKHIREMILCMILFTSVLVIYIFFDHSYPYPYKEILKYSTMLTLVLFLLCSIHMLFAYFKLYYILKMLKIAVKGTPLPEKPEFSLTMDAVEESGLGFLFKNRR